MGRHARRDSHEAEFVPRLRAFSGGPAFDLARVYMSKVDNITKSWTHLRRNLDGQADEIPLPAKLAERKAEYENAANRLRGLIKADIVMMFLRPWAL